MLDNTKMLTDTEFLSIIYQNSLPGAYMLLYEEARVAWLGQGQAWLEGAVRAIRQLRLGTHNCEKLQELYKQYGMPSMQKLQHDDPEIAHRELYLWAEAQGYKLLARAPDKFRCRKVVIEDPRHKHKGEYLVTVWNQTGVKKILGAVFTSDIEAEEWMASNFNEKGYSWELRVKPSEILDEVREALGRGVGGGRKR